MGSNLSHNYYVTKDAIEKIETYDEDDGLCVHDYFQCPANREHFDDTELKNHRIVRLPELTKFAVRSRATDNDNAQLHHTETLYAIIYTRIDGGFMMSVKRLQSNNPALIHYTAIAGVQNTNVHFSNYEPQLNDVPAFDLDGYNSMLRGANVNTSIVLRVTDRLFAYGGIKTTRVQRPTKGQRLRFAMGDIIRESYPTDENKSFFAARNRDECSVYHLHQILPMPLAVYHVYKLDYRDVRDELDKGRHEFDIANIKRVIDYRS